jgi:hypothetical protein
MAETDAAQNQLPDMREPTSRHHRRWLRILDRP